MRLWLNWITLLVEERGKENRNRLANEKGHIPSLAPPAGRSIPGGRRSALSFPQKHARVPAWP